MQRQHPAKPTASPGRSQPSRAYAGAGDAPALALDVLGLASAFFSGVFETVSVLLADEPLDSPDLPFLPPDDA